MIAISKLPNFLMSPLVAVLDLVTLNKIEYKKYMFGVLKDQNTEAAIKFILPYIDSIPDDSFHNVFEARLKRVGMEELLLERLKSRSPEFQMLLSVEEDEVIKKYIGDNVDSSAPNFNAFVYYAYFMGSKKLFESLLPEVDRINDLSLLVFLRKTAKSVGDITATFLITIRMSLLGFKFNNQELLLLHAKYTVDLTVERDFIQDEEGWLKSFESSEHMRSPFYVSRLVDKLAKENRLKGKTLDRLVELKGSLTKSVNVIYSALVKSGNIINAKGYLLRNSDESQIFSEKIRSISSLENLLNKGYEYSGALKKAEFENMQQGELVGLYMLHNTLPFASGGYATRSHGILRALNSQGKLVSAVSRLGFPNDMPELYERCEESTHEIDDVTYYRLHTAPDWERISQENYLNSYLESLMGLIKEIGRPKIIHAASNYMNGVVAVEAAKILGIKSIYEIRGLWEVTRISREPEFLDSDSYNLLSKNETDAAKKADKVIVITNALKTEMIRRGVDGSKIEIIPNGVNPERFQPLPKDLELLSELSIEQDKVVIGFIGSVVSYEGLDDLVDAADILKSRSVKPFVILVVGDGAFMDVVKARVKEKNLSNSFIFTGRVPHEQVERYYSIVDIAPFPRKPLPVCEMVSPIKPFEAMAMEKIVLSSNVDALSEIVIEGENGFLFEKGSVDSMADKLEAIINDLEEYKKVGQKAREWVILNRDWNVIMKRMASIYDELLNE